MQEEPTGTGDELGVSAEELLTEMGFDAESNLLTVRQAQVLTLREQGLDQATIAEALGCSRANVSSVESSARRNIERARETVRFAELLTAPVRVEVSPGVDLYEVPDLVFDACDAQGVKVAHGVPDLLRLIRDVTPPLVRQGTVTESFVVNVSSSGTVRILTP